MTKPTNSNLHVLTNSLYSWWKKQLELANVTEKVDPSHPSNIYGSLDGLAFDSEKLWIRASNRDHILFVDIPDELVFYEFIPFTNMRVFPSSFKREPIDCCGLLKEYLKDEWQGSRFFTLPKNINIKTESFKGVDYDGIEIEGHAKNALTKDGKLKPSFLNDWRTNIFGKIRSFCDKYQYNENHNDSKPKKHAGDNIYWPYRPSIDNGFINYLKKTTKEDLLREIAKEMKKSQKKQEK